MASKRSKKRRCNPDRDRAAHAAARTYRAAQKKVQREWRKESARRRYGPSGRPAPVVVRSIDPEEPAKVYAGGFLPGSYQAYLSTQKWRKLRAAALLRDKHRCVKCHWGRNLHVHHLTYERLGNEELDDLVTLCARCHGRLHGVAA